MVPRPISRSVIVAAVFLSAVGAAQEPSPQAPIATPTPAASPSVPASPPAALPTPSLSPRPGIDDVPTPVFVPNPRPTAVRATPAPIATPTTAPTAIPTAAPSAMPIPIPSVTATTRSPIETVILPQRQAPPFWLWLVVAAALAMVIVGGLALRHRRDDRDEEWVDDDWSDEAASPVVAAAPLPAFDSARARLVVALRPTRAGLNLISATAECEVTVTNIGTATAEDVRAWLRLTSAREDQEAELAAFYTQAAGRATVPPFALAPGEERLFRAVTALPHDAIHSIDAGGRPMFVPLVALCVRYRDDAGPRRIGRAFVVGVDQGGAKLAPLWLDGPPRSYDQVAARPHGEAVEA